MFEVESNMRNSGTGVLYFTSNLLICFLSDLSQTYSQSLQHNFKASSGLFYYPPGVI